MPSAAHPVPVAGAKRVFSFGEDGFLLDGKPFTVMSGEIHPERVPAEYWRHRIQMTKALGFNTVSVYIFWNAHELVEGRYDFETGNRDIGRFIDIAAEEGLWVLVRPGPYCCGEWDLGGIPAYLLRNDDANLRHFDDKNYLAAAERYLNRLAEILRPRQVTEGGPILMLQVENEFGSYDKADRPYLEFIRDLWLKNGISVPFFTGDGPTDKMLSTGTLPGCAVGLDEGFEEAHWELARKYVPGVPVFSSETYPGWLTHWGEEWQRRDAAHNVGKIQWLVENKKSFNFYVIHGGTNFGFTAGANHEGHGFQPDLTTYDYDAPIGEQGEATDKYLAMRQYMAAAFPDRKIPDMPAPVPAMEIAPVELRPWTSVWAHLPAPVKVDRPTPFEKLGQYHQGMMLYRTALADGAAGRLDFGPQGVRDYALALVDGEYVGAIDRRAGDTGVDLPAGRAGRTLDVLVEAMGHINFMIEMTSDRKGIVRAGTFNGASLEAWDTYAIPLDDAYIAGLAPTPPTAGRPGIFFRGEFALEAVADTFIDMAGWPKGTVWVNGHNLGRYWNIGPQERLYCPAPFLRKGANVILALDLHEREGKTVSGRKTLR